jgi:hypothetical protein
MCAVQDQAHIIRTISPVVNDVFTVRIAYTGAIACCALLFGSLAKAQEIAKACAGMEARSVNISSEFGEKTLRYSMPAEILTVPAEAAPASVGPSGKAVTVIALGPLLGSMDSHDVKADLMCTPKGFALIATITRSGEYNGTAAKNVPWRPKITIVVVLKQSEAIFEAKWKMRVTTGAEITQTDGFPYQKYPITVTKLIK